MHHTGPILFLLFFAGVVGSAWGEVVVEAINALDFSYSGGASEVASGSGSLTIEAAKNSEAMAALPDAYELGLGQFIELAFDISIGSDFSGTSDTGNLLVHLGQGAYGYGVRLNVLDGHRGLIFFETDNSNLGKHDTTAPFGTGTLACRLRITRTGNQEYSLLFAGATQAGSAVQAASSIQPLGAPAFDTLRIGFTGAVWDARPEVAVSKLQVETDAANPLPPTPRPLGPNVLFITVDDLKPTLACYGDPIAVTPNFDRLGDEGMVFKRAYCQFPVCGASRASMTTGLMPEDNGVTGFEMIRARLPGVVTIPQHFRENGYETVAVGKWHDHRTVGDGTPAVEDALSWSLPFNYGGGKVGSSQITDRAGRRWPLAAEAKDEPDSKFADGVRADLALAHIDALSEQYRLSGKPFFLGVGFARPHLPFLAPTNYWALYDRDEFTPDPQQSRQLNNTGWAWDNVHELENYYALEVDADGYAVPFPWDGPDSPNLISVESQKELLHGYYASTSFVDAQLGRLLDALEAEGIADETIVVVVGDHGFHLGDHLKWGKHTPLEQAAHAPFILKAPGVGQRGVPSESLVTFLDIYPTLCELAGLPLPEQPLIPELQAEYGGATSLPLQGRSLIPILEDPSAALRYGAITTYRDSPRGYSYRTDRYRYIEWIESDGSIRQRELFNMVNDPRESVNIAGHPEHALLVNWLSTKMRRPGESPGSRRLNNSPRETLPPELFEGDADADGLLNGHEIETLDTDPFDGDAPVVSFPKWLVGTGQDPAADSANDDDHDGVPLIFEYLGDLDPAAADRFQFSPFLEGGAVGAQLRLPRAELPVDLSLHFLSRGQLTQADPWATSTVDYTIHSNGDDYWMHRWSWQGAPEQAGFFKIKVGRPWEQP